MFNGLCEKCRHVKIITSDRGSTFIMCDLSKTDKNFEKYPRLPVLACSGYVKKEEAASSSNKKIDG